MDVTRPYLDFPLGFDEHGRTAVTDPDDHVRDMIYLVLFTAPGERVNRPEFGCGVKQLVFAPLSDALTAATEQLIHGALIRWLDPVISLEFGLGDGGRGDAANQGFLHATRDR